MTQLTYLLVVAAVAFGIASRLRLPDIPLLMIAGVLLSVFVGDRIDQHLVKDTLGLGLAFLVFSSGVELNPSRYKPQAHAVPWVAVFQFAAAGTVGLLSAYALAFNGMVALYIAFSVAASSTLVVLRHLKQQQQMFEPFGRLVLGVLLVQDAIMIAIITFLSSYGDGLAQSLTSLAASALLAAASILLQRRTMPALLRMLKLDEENLLLGFLFVLCAFATAAWLTGVPIIAAAFFAGFALSSSPVNGVVRGLMGPLNDFFLAIFFTALGALIVIPDVSTLMKGFVLAALVVVVTPPVVTIVAEWTGLSSRASIESGLLLAQTSEFSVVLAYIGLMNGHLDNETFSLIALVTAATMTLTPFIATDRITWKLLHFHPARGRFDTRIDLKNHVVIIGFGSGGMWTLKPLLEAGHPVVVVDDDPTVVEQLARNGVRVIRGDGTDHGVLKRANARRARTVIAATRRPADSEKIVRHLSNDTDVVVRVFERQDAERITSLGGIPILNSEAAAETFVEWFDKVGRTLKENHPPR